MINRQAMRGTDTKTTTKAIPTPPARTKLTKDAATQTAVKTKGKADAPAKAPRAGAWHGEETSSPSPLVASSAEETAARAEGNEPIRADLAAKDPNHGTYTDKGPARRPRANDPDADENAEEKRQSAVEEHAALPSRHFPHGKL